MDFFPAQIGHAAPEWEADAYFQGEIKKLSSEDYKGKWHWIFFYPLDFTFVCPTEIIEMSKNADRFKALGCEVVFASVDSVHSHKAWAKADIGDLAYPTISDLNKELSMAYGILHDDGMSLRGSFLVDPEGKLRASIVHDLPVGRNVEETLRVTQAFQSGELCPVGWNKGEKTLGKA